MSSFTAVVTDDLKLQLPEAALPLIYPGQQIEINLADTVNSTVPRPNYAALQMLAEIEEMSRNMPESDPSNTNRYIREARSGVMYADSNEE